MKNKVYSGVKATTLAGLKLRIQEAFEETRLETMSLIKTYDNALYRMKLVSENGGKHIEISVKNRKNLVVLIYVFKFDCSFLIMPVQKLKQFS